ncbi:MAG TPA: hypothetical protein VK149_11625 [Sideroxyarcus sp.]|nr:hypothetical protein [Sideroxyarcus sp.]
MSEDNLIFGHYLVAFVDLLGQRDSLKKFSDIPKDKNGNEYQEFVNLVKETVGAVDGLQQTARKFFETFTKQDGVLQVIPDLHKYNETEIKFQHFSDGLVIYVPLKEDDGYAPAKGIYGAIVVCGMLCLMGLAKQQPVRVGVAIGVSAELRNNELYGKAVAEAYEMESFVAQYPRVVVTNELVGYLKSKADQVCEPNDIGGRFKADLAKSTLELLSPDFDGRFIVNYLGDPFKRILDNTKLPSIAYQYVAEELLRHQEKQNTKLAFRYSLLHGYFFSHMGEPNYTENNEC